MKNVTITLEETVAQWARVEAAKAGKSLSRWIGERLSDDMRSESRAARGLSEWLDADLWNSVEGKTTRAELYEQHNDRPGFGGLAEGPTNPDLGYQRAAERFLEAARLAATPGVSANLPKRDELYDRPALRRHKSVDLLPRSKRPGKTR
jgi:hypothetical protein